MKNEFKKYKRVLTIAGSDSGGGAGIQADLKTISALGCYGMSVVTALTAQNTKEVHSIFDVSASFISDQLNAVLSDIGVDVVKIGMLHRPEIITTVANLLKKFNVQKIVLDPVMIAKSGDLLLQKEAILALKEYLFPVASVLTPNLPEASVLLNREVVTTQDMKKAGQDLLNLGSTIVIIKGGHSNSSESSDYICFRDQTNTFSETWLYAKRINTENTHGTGCTLSSAIASYMAMGHSPLGAMKNAKNFLTRAIEAGANYKLGKGHGPVHHFHATWKESIK